MEFEKIYSNWPGDALLLRCSIEKQSVVHLKTARLQKTHFFSLKVGGRFKSEATTTISGASSEKAKIIFTSGVILEMPASHISGNLLKVLSEVQ